MPSPQEPAGRARARWCWAVALPDPGHAWEPGEVSGVALCRLVSCSFFFFHWGALSRPAAAAAEAEPAPALAGRSPPHTRELRLTSNVSPRRRERAWVDAARFQRWPEPGIRTQGAGRRRGEAGTGLPDPLALRGPRASSPRGRRKSERVLAGGAVARAAFHPLLPQTKGERARCGGAFPAPLLFF